jgi:CheY-like chemotaxis protein
MPASVLVADDNATNLKVACIMLRKLGYDTSTAVDGRGAVAAVASAMAHQRPLSAVLMDVNMPEVDGLEATRQILTTWGADAPPIIAVTATAMPENWERCAAVGMVDYLTKPLELSALTAKLAHWQVRTPHGHGGHLPHVQSAAPSLDTVLVDFGRLEEFREFDDAERTLAREVLRLFLADGPRRLAAISAALAAKDAASLAAAAHALKGAASNVGAQALHALCVVVEAHARQGEVGLGVQSLVADLHALWSRTHAALQAWVDALPGR